jgi:hypothetical protein
MPGADRSKEVWSCPASRDAVALELLSGWVVDTFDAKRASRVWSKDPHEADNGIAFLVQAS